MLAATAAPTPGSGSLTLGGLAAQESPPEPPAETREDDPAEMRRTPEEPAAEGTPPALAQEAGEEPDRPVSPLGAFLRSLAIPGWGQVAAEQPGRGGAYFAAWSASLFMVFKTQSRLASARRGLGEDDPLVESRIDQREDWIVLSVFFALMSGVDAWVSAHLYDFEGQISPPDDGSAGVEVGYRIPVGAP